MRSRKIRSLELTPFRGYSLFDWIEGALLRAYVFWPKQSLKNPKSIQQGEFADDLRSGRVDFQESIGTGCPSTWLERPRRVPVRVTLPVS
jgi:hypothetical protein